MEMHPSDCFPCSGVFPVGKEFARKMSPIWKKEECFLSLVPSYCSGALSYCLLLNASGLFLLEV